MGRKKKQQDQPSAEAERQVEAGEVPAEKEAVQPHKPHNLSRDQLLTLIDNEARPKWVASLAELDQLATAHKSGKQRHRGLGKLLRAEYGPTVIKDIETMLKLETPEGEAELQAEIVRQLEVGDYMASAIGTQLSMFDQSREPAVDLAARIGRSEGRSNKQFDNNRYAVGTPQRKAYDDAFTQARTLRNELMARNGFKPLSEAAPAPLGPPEPTVEPADVGRREGLLAEDEAGYDPHRYFDDAQQKQYHEAFMAAQIERVSAKLEHMGIAAE